MDVLRLLSRGTRSKTQRQSGPSPATLPSEQKARPQPPVPASNPKKRKRDHTSGVADPSRSSLFSGLTEREVSTDSDAFDRSNYTQHVSAKEYRKTTPSRSIVSRSLPERKALLKQHKIKAAWLKTRTSAARATSKLALKSDKVELIFDPVLSFDELHANQDVPTWLMRNLHRAEFEQTTQVQMAALVLQAGSDVHSQNDTAISDIDTRSADLLVVAPTGSGKTLAFLIPTIHRILEYRREIDHRDRHASALILAPTRELVDQIVNAGRTLLADSGLRISQYRKGMKVTDTDVDELDGETDTDQRDTILTPDIIVATPGLLSSVLAKSGATTGLCETLRYLVLDEADVLLDPLFRDQTLGIWNRLCNPDLQVSLWSATMGSNIEELVQSIMQKRRHDLSALLETEIDARPLIRLVVGLKDSAVPNVEHRLIYAATEQGKLMGLRQMLHPTAATVDSTPALRPPFIIFTQTIERAVDLHSELQYDIPAEAGGISRIAVLHSELSDTAREHVMSGFRTGEVWVLITTDLLSRGIDFRGVNGVVNYDIPSSSAAYVHRVGRTGRAGREGGIAVTLYSKEDIPYLKHIANVVAAAQREQDKTASTGSGNNLGIQKWLLDALPKLSKEDKKRFKKSGVEARTARGMATDAKAARRARISTKSGYDRKLDNKKTQTIQGSKRRAAAGHEEINAEADSDPDPEADAFGGFA